MLLIDCPLCAGEATTDDGLTVVSCEGCDLNADIAPDPAATLEVAA
jgi:hypothetical protein